MFARLSQFAVVVCIVSIGEAATLRINFAGMGQFATVTPASPSVDVEVWMDLLGPHPANPVLPEYVSEVGFSMIPVVGDPVVQTGVTWAATGNNASSSHPVPGGEIPLGPGADWGISWASGSEPFGPGTFLLGTMTFKAVDFTPATHELAIEHFDLRFLDQSGTPYEIHNIYNELYPFFFGYGDWGCGYSTKGHPYLLRNPLELNVVPEPATLAVLAVGGLAMVCRRRSG